MFDPVIHYKVCCVSKDHEQQGGITKMVELAIPYTYTYTCLWGKCTVLFIGRPTREDYDARCLSPKAGYGPLKSKLDFRTVDNIPK